VPDFIEITEVMQIYSGVPSSSETTPVGGDGSIYTYKAYGTAGQSVEVRGGFAGDAWADMEVIAVLTVGGRQSAVAQHTWPVIAAQGAATLKIARGAA